MEVIVYFLDEKNAIESGWSKERIPNSSLSVDTYSVYDIIVYFCGRDVVLDARGERTSEGEKWKSDGSRK